MAFSQNAFFVDTAFCLFTAEYCKKCRRDTFLNISSMYYVIPNYWTGVVPRVQIFLTFPGLTNQIATCRPRATHMPTCNSALIHSALFCMFNIFNTQNSQVYKKMENIVIISLFGIWCIHTCIPLMWTMVPIRPSHAVISNWTVAIVCNSVVSQWCICLYVQHTCRTHIHVAILCVE